MRSSRAALTRFALAGATSLGCTAVQAFEPTAWGPVTATVAGSGYATVTSDDGLDDDGAYLGAEATLTLAYPGPPLLGDVSLAFTLSAERDPGVSDFASLTATLTRTGQIGGLTFGAEAGVGLEYDSTAEDEVYRTVPDWGLWLEGERFGTLSLSYASSAVGETCVGPPGGSDNFGLDAIALVGTCPSYDTRTLLYYVTPALGRWRLAASYMPDRFGVVEEGDAEESVAAALIYQDLDAEGVDGWSGTLGVEKVLAVYGEDAEPTAWQAGLARARDGRSPPIRSAPIRRPVRPGGRFP